MSRFAHLGRSGGQYTTWTGNDSLSRATAWPIRALDSELRLPIPTRQAREQPLVVSPATATAGRSSWQASALPRLPVTNPFQLRAQSTHVLALELSVNLCGNRIQIADSSPGPQTQLVRPTPSFRSGPSGARTDPRSHRTLLWPHPLECTFERGKLATYFVLHLGQGEFGWRCHLRSSWQFASARSSHNC